MKKMTKILILRIESCDDCPYFSGDTCDHPSISWGYGEDPEIPDWCPLPEEEKVE